MKLTQIFCHQLHRVKLLRFAYALCIATLGIMNGLTAFLLTRQDHFAFLWNIFDQFAPFMLPITLFTVSRNTIMLIIGAFLIITATGIARGKQRAWQLVIILLPLSTLVHLTRGWRDIVYLFLVLSLWYGFLMCRRSFRVEGDPIQFRRGFVLLVFGCILLTCYGLINSSIIPYQFFISGMTHIHLYTSVRGSVSVVNSLSIEWFLFLLPWCSGIALLAGLVVLLRPVSARWWAKKQQERVKQVAQKASELVGRYGRQTLAFFSLAPENLHYLTADEKGLVSYRLAGNVAVALGDPICSPEMFKQVAHHFLAMCESYDWSPAFFQVHAEQLPAYYALGLQALKIGEEAMLDLKQFTLSGSAMANVRTSARRAQREGVQIEWYEGIPSHALMEQLYTLSEEWLERKAGKNATELGFSMGRLSELTGLAQRADTVTEALQSKGIPLQEIPRFITGVAANKAGQICGFVTFTPIYGECVLSDDGTFHMQHWGWALDLVRRTSYAPPGIIEHLLVNAIGRFRECGAQVLSLGMIALSDTQDEMTDHQHQITSFISRHTHLLSSHHSLFHFKQKFHPRWESRYIVTATTLGLLRSILILMRIVGEK